VTRHAGTLMPSPAILCSEDEAQNSGCQGGAQMRGSWARRFAPTQDHGIDVFGDLMSDEFGLEGFQLLFDAQLLLFHLGDDGVVRCRAPDLRLDRRIKVPMPGVKFANPGFKRHASTPLLDAKEREPRFFGVVRSQSVTWMKNRKSALDVIERALFDRFSDVH
jgi:hypothetical protein